MGARSAHSFHAAAHTLGQPLPLKSRKKERRRDICGKSQRHKVHNVCLYFITKYEKLLGFIVILSKVEDNEGIKGEYYGKYL